MLGALSHRVSSGPVAAASLSTGAPSDFNPHTEHPLAGTQYHMAPMNATQSFVHSVTNVHEGVPGWTDVRIPGRQLIDEASTRRTEQHDEDTLLHTSDAASPKQDEGDNTPLTDSRCESPEANRSQLVGDKPNIFITPPDSESDNVREVSA